MERRPSPAGYILEGHTPRAVGWEEFIAWWAAHPGPERAVAQETLPDGRWLSTVFLGHDHDVGGGPPLLFETMLFKSEDDLREEYCARYATWDEAAAGHAAVLRRIREGAPLYDDEDT
jgi:hypothetical protein